MRMRLNTCDMRQRHKNYNVSECRRFSRDRLTVKQKKQGVIKNCHVSRSLLLRFGKRSLKPQPLPEAVSCNGSIVQLCFAML